MLGSTMLSASESAIVSQIEKRHFQEGMYVEQELAISISIRNS